MQAAPYNLRYLLVVYPKVARLTCLPNDIQVALDTERLLASWQSMG